MQQNLCYFPLSPFYEIKYFLGHIDPEIMKVLINSNKSIYKIFIDNNVFIGWDCYALTSDKKF